MSIVDEVLKVRPPKPKFEVLSSILKRFSPRVFSGAALEEGYIHRILEAARLTPSARFHQPWFFYVIKKDTISHNKIALCLPDRNKWALRPPIIIIACYDPKEPAGEQNQWAQYDLGAAVMALVLQAQDLGIYARQIGSFSVEEVKKQFDIKEQYIPFTLIALGKLGTEKDYAESESLYVEKDLMPPKRKDKIYTELL